ncbi:MAG: hypothetical protein LBH81_00095 [Rickettsiales bacterium]|jgi:cell shape-determining protein MreC|nr:hypothetical protein [Rickettsiales bacterium]
MAFNNKNLSVIAYANGFTMWHYKSEDTVAQVTAVNYFLKTRDAINTGDMLVFSGEDGVGTVKLFKVINGSIITTAI